jgi:apolipoprotein N-acyltransferase
MAVVRGIEGGFAVVRSAQEGRVTVSDHLGRVLAEATSSSAPDVLVVSAVQAGPGHTFYSVSGDWFAWLMLLLLGLMLAGGALRTVKTRTRYRQL